MAQSQVVRKNTSSEIVIDKDRGLVFENEDQLFKHFAKEVDQLERDFFALRSAQKDIDENSFAKFEPHLADLLEDPDEVWEWDEKYCDQNLVVFIKDFSGPGEEGLFHVALCYLTDDIPSFVYLHFPTIDRSLLKKYQKGEIVYSRAMREAPIGALDGDALNEGDDLAMGLYNAMKTLRADSDISEDRFVEFYDYREAAVEEADEIWRKADSYGNVLVNFIKEFDVNGEAVKYIVVTLEDGPSHSHALLFSFPTRDKSLADRYRQGENLQADEVVQESSH